MAEDAGRNAMTNVVGSAYCSRHGNGLYRDSSACAVRSLMCIGVCVGALHGCSVSCVDMARQLIAMRLARDRRLP
jgi:hypothetical protein